MSSGRMNLEDRQRRLAQAISARTMQGWNVVDRNDTDCSAVLDLPNKKINHVLHFLITLFTCVWGIVWIIMAANAGKDLRLRVSIDTFGNMLEEPVQLR